MGNLLAMCACNVASCVCASLCSSCEKATKKSGLCGRIVYAIILLVLAVAAFFLRNVPSWVDSSEYVAWIPGFHGCSPANSTAWVKLVQNVFHTPNLDIPEQLCYGTMSVYRVSFSLTVFHGILALIMIRVLSKDDPRNDVQHGWWSIKILGLVGVIVGSFFIPNDFFLYYGWVALLGSAIFILIQLILLVDFAHSWTESWVGKYEETQSRCWAGALLCATVVLYLIAITLSVVMYFFFMENQSVCWHNPMFVTFNVVLCFVISIASVHPKLQEKNPRIGLLQSAVVTCYSTYLVWSALASQPAKMGCSKFPLGQPTSNDGVALFLGVAFTFLALVYSAMRVSTSKLSSELKQTKKQKEKLIATLTHEDEFEKPDTKMGDEEKGEKKEKSSTTGVVLKEEEDSEDEIEELDDDNVSYNYSYFHFTFLLASMYLGMVLTNWQSVSSVTGDGLPDNTILIDQGMSAVWVKVISSWVTLLLFFWTMIAPVVLPNRKFWD